MLDYALGKEGTPENALGADVTEKYGRVGLSLRIGETSLQILRAWDDSGPRTKTQLNGEWLTASEFSQTLLTALEYPLVRFPQGNPYSDRTWPALTFRTALRHIYRSETDWTDLAPRQPESDQHAVLALFLGVAEELFPDTYGQMVDAQKRLKDLEAESAAYERILSDVTREILAVPGSSVTITPESTDISRQALSMELAQLEAARLESVTSPEPDNKEYFAKQAEARAVLVARMERLAQQREDAKGRLAEVSGHRVAPVRRRNGSGEHKWPAEPSAGSRFPSVLLASDPWIRPRAPTLVPSAERQARPRTSRTRTPGSSSRWTNLRRNCVSCSSYARVLRMK